MAKFLTLIAAALAALAICAPAQAQAGGVIEAGEVRFEAIGARDLPAGACGVFLWGRASINPILIGAAFDNTADLVVRANGRERRLRRVAFEGPHAWGHFAKTRYEGGGFSVEIEVAFDADRPMQDGAMIERGVFRVIDEDDWETVIPVGGMAACRRVSEGTERTR